MSAVAKDLQRLQSAGHAPNAPDRAVAMKRAREALAPSLNGREAPLYPVQALGPLAEACTSIADAGQVQSAMVGQCLLGAASLLTQGLHNVETPNGKRPLSLYLLTLGDSGDGKSTAQAPALRPVNEWQREASHQYREALATYEAARAKRKKGEEPPQPPAAPYRLVSDATVEGLRRDLDGGPSSQGVFTDEAAAILAGYGMRSRPSAWCKSTARRELRCAVLSGLLPTAEWAQYR
jgi:hypothetical protein